MHSTIGFTLVLGLVASVCAGPYAPQSSWGGQSPPAPDANGSPSGAASSEQIFYGRFISTPSIDELLIQTGAVLVSNNNGSATILNAVWDVQSPEDAQAQFNVGSEVPVIQAADDGFFFPGFIGILCWMRSSYLPD